MVSSSWLVLVAPILVSSTNIGAGVEDGSCASQDCEQHKAQQNDLILGTTLTAQRDEDSDYASLLQYHAPHWVPTTKENRSEKAYEIDFSDSVESGTQPRYSPADRKTLLWSGDDSVKFPAATITKVTPLEQTEDENYARVAATAPGCAEECQQWPKCARMNSGYGRLGNLLSQLYQSWYMINASTWFKGASISPRYIPYIFEFPEYICLNDLSRFHLANGSDVVRSLAPECGSANTAGFFICGQTDHRRNSILAQQYMHPYFSRDMKGCLAKDRGIDEDKLVTIHFRGEDVFGMVVGSNDVYKKKVKHNPLHQRMVEQPFCWFYEKLIGDSDWERVLLVTSQDLRNPCIRYLDTRRSQIRNRNGQLLQWELQTSNIISDTCALLKARHFITSMSSFSHNLAVLAASMHPIQVYQLVPLQWRNVWMLRCGIPNMTLHLYNNNNLPTKNATWDNGTQVEDSYYPLINFLLTARNFTYNTDC